MYFSFKQCPIKLNNNYIIANNGAINIELNPNALFTEDSSHVSEYRSSPYNSSLRMDYYLTGTDIVKTFFTREDTVISGNIGGLYFKSGYLKNYSFIGNPNNAIVAAAEIVFFDDLKGSFLPSTPNFEIPTSLNFSNATISGNNLGVLTQVNSLSYNYSAEIEPSYVNLSGAQPTIERVCIGKKQVEMTAKFDNLSIEIPFNLQTASLTALLKDQNGQTKESFSITGVLYKKEINNAANQIVTSTIGIRQHDFLYPPIITSFEPSAINPQESNSLITVHGENFYKITQIKVGNTIIPFNYISVSGETLLTFRPDWRCVTDFIYITNQAGVGVSLTLLTILDGGMRIF